MLWIAVLLLITALATGATYLINRYLGDAVSLEREQRTLRVMTWNIGKLYLKWDSRAADRDLSHVADVIREVAPHLVALQELRGPTQLGRLATMLGPQWRASVPEDQYDRRAGLLVRIPVQFIGFPTSTGRIAQGAQVNLGRGTRFTVASLHLDAFDPKRRMLQAEEILAGANRLGDRNMVLAGDFNFDASVAAHGSLDQRLYRLLTQELVDAASDAGATTVVSRRLDYVFYRSARVKRVSAQVLQDKRINIMDHDPLVVELSLR